MGKEGDRGICLSFLYALIDLLYPRLCVVCRKCLTRGEHFLCTYCLCDFPFSDVNFSSGRELSAGFEASGWPDKVYSLFYYNKFSDYKSLVHAVKYRSRKELGVYLGKMLGERLRGKIRVDGIVPVPLHPKRERKRGFNQSCQIALGVAEILQVEIWDNVIVRTKNNVTQTGLAPEERKKNAEGIFALTDAVAVTGKHILIIDDVITTGATVHACMKTLAEAGDVRFSLACLARTQS
ncbi:MAG: ComF family protein [Oscillibacter sp.]|nr:ComF family protein [Oscillibacter sp.]